MTQEQKAARAEKRRLAAIAKKENAKHVPFVGANQVLIRFSQDFMKEVTKKGAKVLVPVKHFMERKFATTSAIESEKLSTFLVANLAQHQIMQKAQYGTKGAFDQSQSITLEILVNDQLVQSGIKFSTNEKALARILEQYPTIVSMVFNPKSFEYGTSKAQVLNLVKGVNTVIAKGVDMEAGLQQLAASLLNKELPAPETETKELPASTTNVIDGVIVPEALVNA
jgi:hypothetical protein